MLEKITVEDVMEFIFENYYTGILFTKKDSYCSLKTWKKRFTIICFLINKNIPHPSKKKEGDELLKKKAPKTAKKNLAHFGMF